MKNTKTKSIVALAIVLVLTVVFGIVGVTGMSFQGGLWKLLPWLPTTNADAWPQAISLGLDLRGGVYVEYSAEAPEGNDANFSDLLDATVSAIQSRLTDKGYAESTVQVLGTSGIRVEIPDVSDPSEILNLIGEPALLEFKDPDGNTFMTGSDVRLAQAAMTQDGQWAISFQLTSAGTKLFADMTSQNIGKTLGIYLDGEKLMAPTVQSAITGGSGQITGNFTMDRAQTIAAQIQSGALPLVLTQQKVQELAQEPWLILLCGHYEGIDQRVLDELEVEELSVGNYVLTGGELPAMVMVDAISRMVPGVLTNEESGSTESLEGGLLEYPQYSRPANWNGKEVPQVLLSGDHKKIESWRHEQSVQRTLRNRPELLEEAELSRADVKQILKQLKK